MEILFNNDYQMQKKNCFASFNPVNDANVFGYKFYTEKLMDENEWAMKFSLFSQFCSWFGHLNFMFMAPDV